VGIISILLVCVLPHFPSEVFAWGFEHGTSAGFLRKKFYSALAHPPPVSSFNWYQSGLGHSLSLASFVTRRRHGERCREARCLQW
jgi:hypothetical protein